MRFLLVHAEKVNRGVQRFRCLCLFSYKSKLVAHCLSHTHTYIIKNTKKRQIKECCRLFVTNKNSENVIPVKRHNDKVNLQCEKPRKQGLPFYACLVSSKHPFTLFKSCSRHVFSLNDQNHTRIALMRCS